MKRSSRRKKKAQTPPESDQETSIPDEGGDQNPDEGEDQNPDKGGDQTPESGQKSTEGETSGPTGPGGKLKDGDTMNDRYEDLEVHNLAAYCQQKQGSVLQDVLVTDNIHVRFVLSGYGNDNRIPRERTALKSFLNKNRYEKIDPKTGLPLLNKRTGKPRLCLQKLKVDPKIYDVLNGSWDDDSDEEKDDNEKDYKELWETAKKQLKNLSVQKSVDQDYTDLWEKAKQRMKEQAPSLTAKHVKLSLPVLTSSMQVKLYGEPAIQKKNLQPVIDMPIMSSKKLLALHQEEINNNSTKETPLHVSFSDDEKDKEPDTIDSFLKSITSPADSFDVDDPNSNMEDLNEKVPFEPDTDEHIEPNNNSLTYEDLVASNQSSPKSKSNPHSKGKKGNKSKGKAIVKTNVKKPKATVSKKKSQAKQQPSIQTTKPEEENISIPLSPPSPPPIPEDIHIPVSFVSHQVSRFIDDVLDQDSGKKNVSIPLSPPSPLSVLEDLDIPDLDHVNADQDSTPEDHFSTPNVPHVESSQTLEISESILMENSDYRPSFVSFVSHQVSQPTLASFKYLNLFLPVSESISVPTVTQTNESLPLPSNSPISLSDSDEEMMVPAHRDRPPVISDSDNSTDSVISNPLKRKHSSSDDSQDSAISNPLKRKHTSSDDSSSKKKKKLPTKKISEKVQPKKVPVKKKNVESKDSSKNVLPKSVPVKEKKNATKKSEPPKKSSTPTPTKTKYKQIRPKNTSAKKDRLIVNLFSKKQKDKEKLERETREKNPFVANEIFKTKSLQKCKIAKLTPAVSQEVDMFSFAPPGFNKPSTSKASGSTGNKSKSAAKDASENPVQSHSKKSTPEKAMEKDVDALKAKKKHKEKSKAPDKVPSSSKSKSDIKDKSQKPVQSHTKKSPPEKEKKKHVDAHKPKKKHKEKSETTDEDENSSKHSREKKHKKHKKDKKKKKEKENPESSDESTSNSKRKACNWCDSNPCICKKDEDGTYVGVEVN